MQGRAGRAARGTLIGTCAVVLAAASHAAAGGGAPGWLAVVVGVVGASVLGTLVIGRRPALVRTAIVIGVSQGAFHYLFAGLGGPGMRVAAGHVHGPAGAPVLGTEHAAHLLSPAMVGAHAIAALLTVLLVHRADAALWRMLRRALARILGPAIPHVRSGAAPRVPVGAALPMPPRSTSSPPPPGRAPPLVLAV